MKILVAECMQEISSFNPLPSEYENFHTGRGDELFAQRDLNTSLGGAFEVFDGRPDVQLAPTYSARAGSAGILSSGGWKRLSSEFMAAIESAAEGVDAAYVSLHGAMGAEDEPDPEGYLLARLRQIVGPDVPIVISLDLHGILTDRMLKAINGLAIYHTYPHVDFADTGARAARLLLDIADSNLRPAIARVVVPMLARGDECITKTGCYGDVIREARLLERNGAALAAGVMIGNPFTDAPELCTQALVVSERDGDHAAGAASELAMAMWRQRHRLVGKLIAPEKAVEQARHIDGPVVFTDAADATSSGASGDSNAILRALRDSGYSRKVLAQIVDPEAARKAHEAGVGSTVTVRLGGYHDPKRFEPFEATAMVELLSRGRARLETMGIGLDAGPTAVLSYDNVTVVVMSYAVSLFDRAMYYANGLDPRNFDLTIVKSPHTEYHMYDQWVEKNFNIDAPGATSANLASLGHRLCSRPMYPLEDDAEFSPRPVVYRQGQQAT